MKKLFILLIMTKISLCLRGQAILDSVKIKDSTLYQFINDWVGVKYKIGGNSKNGVDCSGFSKILYDSIFDVDLPRIAKEQYKFTNRIKKDSLKLGDLVFFRTRSRSGWHVGVYLMDGYFVHSENRKTGVKFNNLSDSYYNKTYLSGGRFLL